MWSRIPLGIRCLGLGSAAFFSLTGSDCNNGPPTPDTHVETPEPVGDYDVSRVLVVHPHGEDVGDPDGPPFTDFTSVDVDERVLFSAMYGTTYHTTVPTTTDGRTGQSNTNPVTRDPDPGMYGQVTVTTHLHDYYPATSPVNMLFFRVQDPDDDSYYEEGDAGGDNDHFDNEQDPLLVPKFVLEDPVTGSQVTDYGQILPVAVRSGSDVINGVGGPAGWPSNSAWDPDRGAAEVVLHFTNAPDDRDAPRYCGNNYEIEVSTDQTDWTHAVSTVLVAWKRMYVEVDTMYRAGSLVNSIPASNRVVVQDIAPFLGREGQEIHVFDAYHNDGEKALISLIVGNTLYLEKPAGTQYNLTKTYVPGTVDAQWVPPEQVTQTPQTGTDYVEVADASLFVFATGKEIRIVDGSTMSMERAAILSVDIGTDTIYLGEFGNPSTPYLLQNTYTPGLDHYVSAWDNQYDAAVGIPSEGVFAPNVTELWRTFGGDTRGQDGGCFVEFHIFPPGQGSDVTPYRDAVTNGTYDGQWFRHYSEELPNRRLRRSAMLLSGITRLSRYPGFWGASASDVNRSFVCVQKIEDDYGAGSNMEVTTSNHETSHQVLSTNDTDHGNDHYPYMYGVARDPDWEWSWLAIPDSVTGRKDHCIMSYESSYTDTNWELCPTHLWRARRAAEDPR